jgi:hypothetical protein
MRLRTPWYHAPQLYKGENRNFCENVDMESGFFSHFLKNFFRPGPSMTTTPNRTITSGSGSADRHAEKKWLLQQVIA